MKKMTALFYNSKFSPNFGNVKKQFKNKYLIIYQHAIQMKNESCITKFKKKSFFYLDDCL